MQSHEPDLGHEAKYYMSDASAKVTCYICPKNCLISEGKTGFCGVRQNKSGKLYLTSYGKPCSIAIDPIEKKPLHHFFPGKKVFSIATVGCNLNCKHCQNIEISRGKLGEFGEIDVSPEEIVKQTIAHGCNMIAYTYTEPTVFFEFMIDTAKLAKEKGIKNILVSNGYINPEPLKELAKYIDAANIDLKAFDDDFYKKICMGSLKPVLKTIKTLHKKGVWVEVTNLIIPTLNDSDEKILSLVEWLESVSKDIPLHFSRFFPMHVLKHIPATPPETLHKAYTLAKERLKYVYIGNMEHDANSSYCHSCGNMIVKRSAYDIDNKISKEGKCTKCGTTIPGIWS